MKNITLILVFVVLPVFAKAQLVSLDGVTQKSETVSVQKEDAKKTDTNTQVSENTSADEVQAADVENVEDVPPPPTTITPAEIAELEIASKKVIRLNVKKQNKKEREQFINAMTWGEKNLKMRELMKNGMSYNEAKKEVEKLVKAPQIDVKKDSEVEGYIYEKGNFLTNGK